MAEKSGTVSPGGQNTWLERGVIYESLPEGKSFSKKNATPTACWRDSACWTGGTPVTWEDDYINDAKATTAKVDKDGKEDGKEPKIEMLVTRDSKGKIVEYHPLITFYNGVMAQIMKDGHLDLLKGLDKPRNAIKLWEYLKGKYGAVPDSGGANKIT